MSGVERIEAYRDRNGRRGWLENHGNTFEISTAVAQYVRADLAYDTERIDTTLTASLLETRAQRDRLAEALMKIRVEVNYRGRWHEKTKIESKVNNIANAALAEVDNGK